MTLILAVETSCDETGAAVIENGRTILSNVVASQEAIHAQYGGVFPEIASRRHVEVIYPIVHAAVEQSGRGWEPLDAIAVTHGPGLVGSLLVGVNMAKGLALALDKPLLGVNHIEGHIYAQWLTGEAAEIRFPIVVLVVSGGHTELYLMTGHRQYRHLGGTIDDAAGEAFDKVGRLLGLPYPGGPAIDRAALDGDPAAFDFPRAMRHDGYDFSFSGLKTAVLREIEGQRGAPLPVADLAASFQTAVVDVLVEKTARAAEAYGATAVHLAGGVSANSQLRRDTAARCPLPVRTPPLALCTDNAAMIGAAAHQYLMDGVSGRLDLDVIPGLRLTAAAAE